MKKNSIPLLSLLVLVTLILNFGCQNKDSTPNLASNDYRSANERLLAYDDLSQSKLIITGDIVTMDQGRRLIKDGQVVVNRADGKIVEIREAGNRYRLGKKDTEIKTDGYVYPGLIDLHNHVEYNANRLVQFKIEKTDSRYKWQGYKEYKEWFHTYNDTLAHEMKDSLNVYSEVKALVGGVTLIEGIDDYLKEDTLYDCMLMNFRSSEFQNKVEPLQGRSVLKLPLSNKVYSNIFVYAKWERPLDPDSIDFPFNGCIPNIILSNRAVIESNRTKNEHKSIIDAFIFHLGEGYDARNKFEFTKFTYNQLLDSRTVLLHGIALETKDYQLMAKKGATLVWSPTSNLYLYGRTAKVKVAKSLGVNLCLGTDWSPSSTKSLLHELKVAWLHNVDSLDRIFTHQDLVEMVTVNAARAIHAEDKVGALKAGAIGNVVIFDKLYPGDPYRSLVEATESHLQLSIIKGQPMFGDDGLMTKCYGANAPEKIEGFKRPKSIHLVLPSSYDSFKQITAALDARMKKFPEKSQVKLDPILGDQLYFDQLKHAIKYDISVFWK